MTSILTSRLLLLTALARPASGARLRIAAPFLLAACIMVAGCSRNRCDVATAEGCLTTGDYATALAGAVEDIRSSPGLDERWALEALNLPEAWAHLRVVRGITQPGLGITVGVVDTGIDFDHLTFQEGAATGQVTEELMLGATDEAGVEHSHGTSVASIIAGRVNARSAFPFTGIVPYARLKMFAIPLGNPPPPDTPIEPTELSTLSLYDEEDAGFYREVLSGDLDVLNLSFGTPGLIENYDDVPDLRASLPKTIEVLAQPGRKDKTILVWAAGNNNDSLCRPDTDNCVGNTETDYLGQPAGFLNASSPDLFAGLMARIEELQGHSVASVATGDDGEIAFFSNRCGDAADWCIAAPGFGVWAAYFGPYQGEVVRGHARLSGTSFSAPMVSGGLALMDQFFRDQLPSDELVTRLFETADRSGHYADRSIYGHGLMDLDAALSPVGTPKIVSGTATVGSGAPVQGARLWLGRAFGDGPARAFSGQEIAGFDRLGAPFWYDLGHFVGPRTPLTPAAQLHDFMAAAPIDTSEEGIESESDATPAGPRFGIGETPGGASIGHARLAQEAFTVTVGRPAGIVATAFTTGGGNLRPVSGALVSWLPANAWLGLRAGWLGESRSMLSAIAEGAFGDLAAHSVFVGLELDHEAGGWRLGGGPEIGFVRSRVRGGIIAAIHPLTTSAFTLHASRSIADNGMLLVSLAQPLRVEDGNAVLSVPVGRTQGRGIVRQHFQADLAPAGRQLDLSVRWEQPFAGGEFRLGATATRHAGHDMDAHPWLTVMAGWRASL